jgi:hypothetical protein
VDPDNRPITITASLPPFATLNQPTLASGEVVTSLTLAPTAAQVGDYTAAVTATAGGVPTVKVFSITVNAAGSDLAPVVTASPLQEVSVGSTLTFNVTASDADGDAITSLNAAPLPFGALFTKNASNTSATFTWAPEASDAGEYDVTFTAENALSGAAVTHIRVAGPPTLQITPIDDVTVEGGQSASVPVHASFMAGALITLTAALPSFATLNPPGSGTGSVNTTITVAPPTGSAGTYHASVTAISNGSSVTEEFDIIVTGSSQPENHAPVLTAPVTETVAAGSPLSFDVSATDADGDHVDLFGSALPPGSSFVDHTNNTGTFTWNTGAGQAGTYTASFSGTDGRGGSGSASTEIIVTGSAPENHAPTVNAPLNASVNEGTNLSFTVVATDEDGDHVTLTANSLPSGATFNDQGDNTGIFDWTQSSTQSGAYTVAFLGNDGHGGTGTASTEITVNDVAAENHPPTVNAPLTAQVDEGVALSFTVTATDPDGDHVTLTANSVPAGASFNDLGDNSGTFSWTPGSTQSGTYQVQFVGDDGRGGTGTAVTTITVDDVGGGGGGPTEVAGKVCHVGGFNPHSTALDFRLRPAEGSFNLSQVDLGSIRLRYRGHTLAAMSGAEIEVDCQNGHNGRGNGTGNPNAGDNEGCGISCLGNEVVASGNGCDTLGIRLSFSTSALLQLFGGLPLPCSLAESQVLATLTNGNTVVARFRGDGHGDDVTDNNQGNDNNQGGNDQVTGNDQGKSNDPATGNDGQSNGNGNGQGQGNGSDNRNAAHSARGVLDAKVWPNPLNPSALVSFTTTRDGQVRVSVYNARGHLLKVLLDGYRAVGQQLVPWDGSDDRNQKVASGVYYLRIQAPYGRAIQRVTVLK